jgi:hypothetical protein
MIRAFGHTSKHKMPVASQHCSRLQSYWGGRHLICYVNANVAKKPIAFILRPILCGSLRQQIPPKWYLCTKLYGIISQRTVVLVYRVLRTSGICLSIVAVLYCQIEKSPTLGSIESSEYEKRQLAGLSLDFNLQDKVFCELFPDMVTVSLL